MKKHSNGWKLAALAFIAALGASPLKIAAQDSPDFNEINQQLRKITAAVPPKYTTFCRVQGRSAVGTLRNDDKKTVSVSGMVYFEFYENSGRSVGGAQVSGSGVVAAGQTGAVATAPISVSGSPNEFTVTSCRMDVSNSVSSH